VQFAGIVVATALGTRQRDSGKNKLNTIERVEVGDHLIIHRPSGQRTNKLLISSHGAIAIINGKSRVNRRSDINLHFYVPHGVALNDPGLSKIINGSVLPLEMLTPGQCPDYSLSKYQEDGGETYDDIEKAIRAAEYGKETGFQKRTSIWPADILTIRNRRKIGRLLGVSLSNVLEDLKISGRNYTNIYCSFCRCKVGIPGIRRPQSADARAEA
jgi:hypothetical protein